MFDDSFKSRYTTLPFATYERKKSSGITDSAPILHNHKEIELLSITDGKAEAYINGERFCAKKGDVLIIAPYMLHRIAFSDEQNFSHKCLCFDLCVLPDENIKKDLENGSSSITPIIRGTDKNSSQLSELISNAFYAHSNQKSGWELAVTGNMCIFFSILKSRGYISSVKTQYNKMCKNIIDFIDKHHAKPITSADISKELFISESYFCRIFKTNFGHPFQKYLCMYRVEKSKKLLKTTDMSVSEIAISVGFNSFSYFSKVFRELTLYTPSGYRKACNYPHTSPYTQ